MRQHRNETVAIAGRAAAGARFAFPGDADAHFVIDAGGNLHFRCNFLEHLPAAAATRAGMFDDGTLTVTLWASRLDANDSGRLDDPTLPAAIAAHFAPAAFGRARAFALAAVFLALNFDRFGDAVRRLV